MSQVKDGDSVKVHYTGKFEDGTVFDSSREREPLELTVGNGNVIPGFEKGILGMKNGSTKEITIPPEEGYGPVRDDLVIEVSKKEIPDNIDPTVGQRLQMRKKDGRVINLTVAEVGESTVKLDANHPLAGKTLIFDVELVEIC